jgi:hypothetical protein
MYTDQSMRSLGTVHVGDDGQDKAKVELFFSCRKLANMDVVTVTDPFLKLYENRGGIWFCLGQTEQIDNNLNPDFSKTFVVDFVFETKQVFKVEIYDFDDANSITYIGEQEFELGELAGAKNNAVIAEIKDKKTLKPKRGYVVVRYENVSENNDFLFFHIGASKLFKKRFFFRNKSFLFFYKPRNWNSVKQLVGSGQATLENLEKNLPRPEDWTLVHRTEYTKGQDVKWAKFKITASKICHGNFDCPIKVVCMDHRDWSGDHRIVGSTIMTVNQLKGGTREVPFTKYGGYRGNLTILSYYDKPNYDF